MGASLTAATGRLHVSQPCKTVPDGARQCHRKSRQADKAERADTFSMRFNAHAQVGGHLQQRQDVFSAWAQARQRHPASCGTAKARRPGVPDGSILPTQIYPGTLAYPHVSASSVFLPTPLHRSHEATARGYPPGLRATLFYPPTTCYLSRSRKLPLPTSTRT